MNSSAINFNKLWQPALVAAFAAFRRNFGGGTFYAEISLVLMLVGIVIYFFGAKVVRFLVVPFALLLLAIPIPQIIFNKIAFPLQIWASQFAVWGIRLFEVASVRKENVIEILPRGATQIIALEVVEACSGIRSLMTLITLALILAYFTRTKRDFIENGWLSWLKNFDIWRAVILMLAAIPIAILTNAARVTATGVLTFYYGKQATESFVHEVSGWLVYVIALGLLIALNFVLKKFHYKNTQINAEERKLKTKQIPHPKSILFTSRRSTFRRYFYQLVSAARRSRSCAKTFD